MALLNSQPGWNQAGGLGYQQNALANLSQQAPQLLNQQNAQTQDSANSQYNQAKQNIDTSYNQRGLLYSGMKQGAEAGAATQAANNAATGVANNNANMNNTLNNAQQQATSTALQGYQGYVAANQQNFANQMAAYNQSQQASGALGSGIGAIAGLGLAAATGGAALPAMVGGGMAGGGLFSDKKLKKNVKDADDDIKEYLDKTDPKSFDYKDSEAHGEGKHVGLMAQDMEKSPAGKLLIVEGPQGKQIDPRKALMMVLAVSSHLNKRMNKVEKYAEGGEVSSQNPPIDPQKAQEAQESFRKAFHFKLGGEIPGSGKERGDTKLGLLQSKEIVLPRKVTMSKNAPEKAKNFVAQVKGA